MQNKLQELTDKLYNEGLAKGRQEAEEMKAKAKKEAADMLEQAKEEARQIISDAQKESDELKAKAENDIKMAAGQAFAAIRQRIENVIVTKAVAVPVAQAVGEKEFLQSIISAVILAFNPGSSESVPLNVILPENKQQELEGFLKEELAKIFQGGLDISFSKNISNGFKIGPQNDGYMLSFTDEDFTNLIAEYLRPKTRKLLFGE